MNSHGQPEPADSSVAAGVLVSEQDPRTRERLLRAAVQIFDRKGYDAASVREIVELAGVTKPALYYHFGSKEGVLLAILRDAERQFTNLMAKTAASPGTVRQRVTAMCEELYGLFGVNVPVIRVAHSVALGPTEVAPTFDFTVFEQSMVAGLKSIIEQGQATGEVRGAAPEDIALAVMGVIGMLAGRQLHPRSEPLGVEGLRRILALVFDGILNNGTNGQAAGEVRQ
jgi:AcrR family transcriptional regulator